jgi:hypothetical protein
MQPHWKIPRRSAPALLVAATITVAAFSIAQRADRPEYAETPASMPEASAPSTDSGMVNPWAAGDAAVARYLTELGRDCLVSRSTTEAPPTMPPQDQPRLGPRACCR